MLLKIFLMGELVLLLTVLLISLHVSIWVWPIRRLGPNLLLRKGFKPLLEHFQCFALIC